MNGKMARALRAAAGFNPHDPLEQNKDTYREHKRDWTRYRGGQLPAAAKPARGSGKKTLLTGKKPQPMGSSAWKRTGPLILVRKCLPGQSRLVQEG